MTIEHCWYKQKCTNVCTSNCLRYKLMVALFKQSCLPESLWMCKDLILICSKQDKPAYTRLSRISDEITAFINNGDNLYIYSRNAGNGKTTWAVRLMYSYFDKIWHKSCFECKALFINVPTFLYNCKRSISQPVKGFEDLCNRIKDVDLVIWDDIAESDVTSFEHQILLQYIDGRINAGKSNIYTSNKDFGQLRDSIGERLASRVYNCSEKIEFKEGDKRGVNNGRVANHK